MYVRAPITEADDWLRPIQGHGVGRVNQVHGQGLPTSYFIHIVELLVMMLAGEARLLEDVDAPDLVFSDKLFCR